MPAGKLLSVTDSAGMLIRLNKLFRPVEHPFNLESDGRQKYCEWEFERGESTLKLYLDSRKCGSDRHMFTGKEVLDVGAGGGGKSLYYLTRGAKRVCAMDIVENYRDEALAYAKRLGLDKKFSYSIADAAEMPFEDSSFDVVIMNDAMEHVRPPEKVISEVRRVLREGGRLYINFPPYGHPFGAHLSDVISIPWVHLFFDEETLIKAYKELCGELDDRDMRISFRISKNSLGEEYFSYINKLTIKRFNEIINQSRMKKVYYKEIPLRSFLSPVAKLPVTKEWFVRSVVCIMEK